MKNQYVYMLQHKRKVEFYEDDWVYDSKLIGFFSSKIKAENVIKRYKNITGFKDYPNDFFIKKIEVDFDDYEFN